MSELSLISSFPSQAELLFRDANVPLADPLLNVEGLSRGARKKKKKKLNSKYQEGMGGAGPSSKTKGLKAKEISVCDNIFHLCLLGLVSSSER